jgi:hypothetical protein
MKNILFWIKNKKSAFLYSIFLFFAFEMMLKIYQEFSPGELNRFYFYAGLIGVILLSTLCYGLLFIRKRYTDSEIHQVILPLVKIHVLHQLILPMLLYVGMVGFIFFYPYDVITHVMIFVISIVYWILFVNIQAVYDRNFQLKELTHGIYNLVNIFTFFFVITSTLELFHYIGADSILIGISAFFVSLILLFLALVRYMQTSTVSIFIAILFSFVIGLFGWYLGGLLFANYFSMGLYLTILYYLLSAIIHHKSEGTLDFSVIVEYFSIAILSMMILSSKF